MEWRVANDMHEEVLEFYTAQVAPKFAESEDMLRLRLFEVDNATTLQGSLFESKERDSSHGYFTLVEFDAEDWPWEDIIELGGNEKWKQYFEDSNVVVGEECT
jgi:hypothetical protein